MTPRPFSLDQFVAGVADDNLHEEIQVDQVLENAAEQPTATFAQRWRGRFQPADRNDERYRALAKRYL